MQRLARNRVLKKFISGLGISQVQVCARATTPPRSDSKPPRHISPYCQTTHGMLLTKRKYLFESPGAIYLVHLEKHDEPHVNSIGLFHHKQCETGFLAFAWSTSEIRTVEVKQSEIFSFPISDIARRYVCRAYGKLQSHRLRETRRFYLFR